MVYLSSSSSSSNQIPGLEQARTFSTLRPLVTDLTTQHNHLSPQSAFFAIATIALSTSIITIRTPICTLKYQASLTPYLKASPTVCLTDTLYTLCKAILTTYQAGFRSALEETIDDKLDTEQDSCTTRPHAIFRILLLLTTALPQAIKVFACGGLGIIPTQIMAASYLFSLILDETLLLLFQRSTQSGQHVNLDVKSFKDTKASDANTDTNHHAISRPSSPAIVSKYLRYLRGVSIHANTLLLGERLIAQVMARTEREMYIFWFIVVPLWFSIALISGIMFTEHPKFSCEITYLLGNPLINMALTQGPWVLSDILLKSKDLGSRIFCMACLFGLSFQASMTLVGSTMMWWGSTTEQGRKWMPHHPCFAHLIFVAVTLAIYYGTHYDALQTERPAWTELEWTWLDRWLEVVLGRNQPLGMPGRH